MKEKSCLMAFERVIQCLNGTGVYHRRLPVTIDPPVRFRQFYGYRASVRSDELIKKLMGTWWEVKLSDEGKMPAQCRYIARSLPDAVRLRPEAKKSNWCLAEKGKTHFLMQVADWLDDYYEIDEEDD
jgi:hypothetical protein